MLNIQPLVIRSSPHSSSFLECAEGKAYNEKIQFAQTIIQNTNTIRIYAIEFLCRSRWCWCARKQTGQGVILVDLMCIEELKEDEVEE
jgi:hypothetical protein